MSEDQPLNIHFQIGLQSDADATSLRNADCSRSASMYRAFIIYEILCFRRTKMRSTHSLSKEIMLKILTGKNEGRSPEVTLC